MRRAVDPALVVGFDLLHGDAACKTVEFNQCRDQTGDCSTKPTSQLTEPHEAYASQSKSEKCEIVETQLRQRARLRLGQSTGYRPRTEPSQMAFRTCKEAMSAIWRWPVLKRKMAIPSRRRTTSSTPNITTDRCSPKKVKYFLPRVDVDPWLDTKGSALQDGPATSAVHPTPDISLQLRQRSQKGPIRRHSRER